MTHLLVLPLALIAAIGAPAFIAARAPQRWRLWMVGLWALAPPLGTLVLVATDKASDAAGAADHGKLVFGLLLIASLLLLPWLVGCGVGFAIGVALRGRGEPSRRAAIASPAARVERSAAPRPPRAVQANPYVESHTSPDGETMVELEPVEWRNGLWVRSPRVTEVATGRELLDLWGTDWDAVPTFPRDRVVRLSLRRFHFGGNAVVELDLRLDRYVLFEASGESVGPLSDLVPAIEAAAQRSLAG